MSDFAKDNNFSRLNNFVMEKRESFKLRRYSNTPIMTPDPTSVWECENVFNPSVIYKDNMFHMHYRAEGKDWISRIGYAVSKDGIHWNRMREPVLKPSTRYDSKGVEDPRVTEIDGIYYMAYCGNAPYSGSGVEYCGSIYPMFAKSRNLIDWEVIGPMVEGEDNKDHMLFPRKFNGRFCAFHRRRPNIWLAFSEDLRTWPESEMKELCGARPEVEWEGKYIGMNGVPIETEAGWLAFYHGADAKHVYRIGVMLLDRQNPSKILSRPVTPILEPCERWERRGDVPNVVFSNSNLLVGDTVYVYYGGGDHVIGLATATVDEIMDFLKKG